MTPRRTVRVDDEMWKLWETAALARGTTVSMLIRDAVNELLGAELVTFAGDVPEPTPAAAPPIPLEVDEDVEEDDDEEWTPRSGCGRPNPIPGHKCPYCRREHPRPKQSRATRL